MQSEDDHEARIYSLDNLKSVLEQFRQSFQG